MASAPILLDAPTSLTGAEHPPARPELVAQGKGPRTLYITLGPAGSFKAGTCAHCVIYEHGRPARAWDADGDRDLDFDRETLLAELAALGVQITDRHAYVCP
jgi:hypothetical protein